MSVTAYPENGWPVETRAAHVHHAITWHSGRRRIVDVVRLEDDLAVGRHGDTISVSESQGLVVVKDGVEILNPDGIDWAVKNQPNVLS